MLPASDRHAYEVVEDKPCRAFFDLESKCDGDRELAAADALAVELAEAASEVLMAAALRQLGVGLLAVSVAALDSHRPHKFSRHLVIKVRDASSGNGLLLASLADAAALAREVATRVGPAAAALVDMAVYSPNRCFHTVASSKLEHPGAPATLNASRSSAELAAMPTVELVLATLVVPAVAASGGGAVASLRFCSHLPPKGAAGMTVGGGSVAIYCLVWWIGHVWVGLRVGAGAWTDGLVAEG